MLIDGGMPDYTPLLLKNLRAPGIERIDSVVLSHRHNDHWGGLLSEGGVLEQLEVGRIYHSGIFNGNSATMTMLEARQIPMQTLCKGDVLRFGDIRGEVLWPLPGLVGSKPTDGEVLSNGSIVIRFSYGDVSALFVGDGRDGHSVPV